MKSYECFRNCWRSGPRPSHHTFGEDIEPSRLACRNGFVGENHYANYQANTDTWHEMSTERCGCLISIAFHPTFEILRGMQNISWTRKHGSSSQSRMFSMSVSVAKIVIASNLPQSSAGFVSFWTASSTASCAVWALEVAAYLFSYSDYNSGLHFVFPRQHLLGEINRDQFAKSEERSEIWKGLISSNFGCAQKDQAICRSVSVNLKDFGILKKCGVNRLQL